MNLLRWLFIITLLLLSLPAQAGTTGKIAGKVVDRQTGEGIPGVNIIIKGTTQGAATNIDGEYTILNVPPGTYVLKISSIGYSSTTVQNVQVNIDLTTHINVDLGETVVELEEEVVITASRPLVQKDQTASTAVIGAEQIEALPVVELSEVLQLQAGYHDGHVRGGRQGELSYWIDGVPVTDVYDGGTVVEVNTNQVQELQLVSGAFNAEYGQAMSGIVNIATKSGGNQFHGHLGSYVGDFASTHSDVFRGIDQVNPTAIANFDGGLNGPVIKDQVTFVLYGRYNRWGGYLNGTQTYNPSNIAYTDSTGTFVESRDPETGMGDGSIVSMNGSEKYYGQGKLSWQMYKGVKVWYQYIYDNVNYQDYNQFFQLNPGGNPANYRIGQTHLAQLTHLLSPNTFYTLGFSAFQKNFKRYVYEDPFDPRYIHPNLLTQITPYSYGTGGTDMTHFERNTRSLVSKFDITSQLTQQHLLKAGAQVDLHTLYYNSITLRPSQDQADIDLAHDSPYIDTRILPVSSIYHDEYTRKPSQMSAYVQDKMEFDDLIINLGVRFDYFDPAGQVLADPTDPNIFDPIRPENRFHDRNGNGIQDPNEPDVTLEERQQYWYRDASVKYQFSPRFGAAFPITDRGVLHFSYGQFFQIPRFEFLYTNPFFKIGSGTGNQGTIGNADLEPEQTTNAEIGLQQAFSEDISMDVTVYIRDVRKLAGTRAEQITIFGGSATYSKLVNSDFAYTRGIVLSMNKRFAGGLAATADYTFQIAKGTASDPYAAQQAAAAGQEPEVQLTPLSWDQMHTITASVAYNGPTWGGSFVFIYGSGFPYTPRRTEDITSLIFNSALKPTTLNADVRLYKNIRLGSMSFNLFLRIFNLFDTMNEVNVFDDTGRAGYTTDAERVKMQNTPEYINTIDDWFTIPTHYSAPRRVELGFSFEF